MAAVQNVWHSHYIHFPVGSKFLCTKLHLASFWYQTRLKLFMMIKLFNFIVNKQRTKCNSLLPPPLTKVVQKAFWCAAQKLVVRSSSALTYKLELGQIVNFLIRWWWVFSYLKDADACAPFTLQITALFWCNPVWFLGHGRYSHTHLQSHARTVVPPVAIAMTYLIFSSLDKMVSKWRNGNWSRGWFCAYIRINHLFCFFFFCYVFLTYIPCHSQPFQIYNIIYA